MSLRCAGCCIRLCQELVILGFKFFEIKKSDVEEAVFNGILSASFYE